MKKTTIDKLGKLIERTVRKQLRESITSIQRDINKVDKDLERVTTDMQKLAKQYRESDAEGKERLLPQMKKKTEEKKDLTDKKTELHAKLSAEVEKSDAGAELEDLDEGGKKWFNNRKDWESAQSRLNVSDDDPNWSKNNKGKLNSFWYEDREEGWVTELNETNINESKYRDKLHKVVELMTRKYFKEYKTQDNKKKTKLEEYSGQFNSTVLREVVDDLLVGTEMLIDEQYGQVDAATFRNNWNNLATEFEKKFNHFLKNTMK